MLFFSLRTHTSLVQDSSERKGLIELFRFPYFQILCQNSCLKAFQGVEEKRLFRTLPCQIDSRPLRKVCKVMSRLGHIMIPVLWSEDVSKTFSVSIQR